MTIEDALRFVETLPDWAILDGCFGGLIRPTDIDGVVERHGFFLILEQKTGAGSVKLGQDILFRAFMSLRQGAIRGNMVLAFGVDGNRITWIRRYWRGMVTTIPEPSVATLRNQARQWFEWVEDVGRGRFANGMIETKEQNGWRS